MAGGKLQQDFFDLVGGLNTADSPFLRADNQAAGGQCFDYTMRGAIKKVAGRTKLNTSANSQAKSIGLGLWDKPGATRVPVRYAGTKIQAFDINALTFTNLTADTAAAGSDFLSSGSTQPALSAMFNTATAGVLWSVGAGQTTVNGVYSGTKVTANGASAPTGTVTTTVNTGGTGTFLAVGTYFYALALVKASTGAESNAALDVSATLTATTQTVTINFGSLAAIDTTKYSKIVVYRSAVSGVSGFTVGDRVAEVSITGGVPTNYTDTGSALLRTVNVGRPGYVVLDRSVLPTATYTSIATWKRRLVVASGTTLQISEVGASESWPLTNPITIPSGGEITGLASLSFTTQYNSSQDEVLCIFKQNELWVLSGSTYQDWNLVQIDTSGCPAQSLVVAADGYLVWVNYQGVYLWDGAGKAVYISQPIENMFQDSGTLRKDLFVNGCGVYSRARKEVQWYLTTSETSAQQYVLRLDMRLTQGAANNDLVTRKMQGVFCQDTFTAPVYAALSYYEGPSATNERLLIGDDAGYLYQAYSTSTSDAGGSVAMSYLTPNLRLGTVGVAKRYEKVILYVLDNGVYNINVDYWVDYAYKSGENSTQTQPVSVNLAANSLIWDTGKWDVNSWDGASQRIRPLVFNLNSQNRGNEGDVLTLRIWQTGASQAPVIYGFSVICTEIAVRK